MNLFEENCLNPLNFSEEWRDMYFKFPWTIEKPYKEDRYRNYSIGSNNNLRKDITPKPHPLLAYLIFNPNTHSTPNKKVIVDIMDIEASSSSVESISFSTTHPDNATSLEDNNVNTSVPDHNNTLNLIPTISQSVDIECRRKFSSGESIPDISQNKFRRKGITNNVVSFTLDDESTVKKTHRIQSCSITLIVLALIVISLVLIYLSSHRHIEIVKINVPMRNDFIIKKKNSNDDINVYPENENIKEAERNDTTTGSILDIKDLEMGDEAMTVKPKHFVDDVNKVINILNGFPKAVKSKNKTVDKKDDEEEFVHRICMKCKLSEEVCMLNESSGKPYCAEVKDYDDVTGCGGLCAIETEACVAVDHQRQVKVCKALISSCPPNHWKCRNGECINSSARCDGNIDCFDNSDESSCACDLDKNFHCGHVTSCFPKEKLCDGVTDCWDGYDESNCGKDCVNKNQFSCARGGCVSFGRVCDGYADCGDGSDEPQGCDGPCRAHEMQCRNGRCVPNILRCDGRDQCGDRSDEIDCT